jgi:hypothetical protein
MRAWLQADGHFLRGEGWPLARRTVVRFRPAGEAEGTPTVVAAALYSWGGLTYVGSYYPRATFGKRRAPSVASRFSYRPELASRGIGSTPSRTSGRKRPVRSSAWR